MPLWSANNPIAFSPSNIDGLVAWYDSNSVISVTRWNDKTLYNNHLYSVYGSISGGAQFSNTLLVNTSPEFRFLPTGATIFVVATQSNNISGCAANMASLFPNYLSPENNLTLGITWSSSNTYKLNPYGLSNSANGFSNITNNLLPNIYTGICFNTSYTNTVGSNGYSFGYYNGAFVAVNSNPLLITTNQSYFGLSVGDASNITAFDGKIHNLNASIYEVILFDIPLAASDIANIHTYLQKRWNTPSLYNGGNFQY